MAQEEHRNQQLADHLDQALDQIKNEIGQDTASQIRSILFSNLDRGRIASIIQDDLGRIPGYVASVANVYESTKTYVRALQIEKSEHEWSLLMGKLEIWIKHFLARVGFFPRAHNKELAKELSREAAIGILSSHFPYDTEFDAWAQVIAQNTCRQYIRKAKRKSQIPDKELVSLDRDSKLMEPASTGFARTVAAYIDLLEAIAELSEARRETIIMLYFEGLSPKEIAKRMNKSVSAIYSLHFNALQDLRKKLTKNGNSNE